MEVLEQNFFDIKSGQHKVDLNVAIKSLDKALKEMKKQASTLTKLEKEAAASKLGVIHELFRSSRGLYIEASSLGRKSEYLQAVDKEIEVREEACFSVSVALAALKKAGLTTDLTMSGPLTNPNPN